MSKRLLLIAMLLPSVAAGCGPLPAGAPPQTAPTRQAAGPRGGEPSSPPATDVGNAESGAAPEARIAMVEDYEAALVRAEAEGMPLLLFFTAPWCEYSRRLEDSVLAEAGPRAAAANFICVRIGADRRDLHEQYRVKVFPTIVSATSRGTASQRLVGAQTVETFVAGVTTALTAMTDHRPAAEAAGRR